MHTATFALWAPPESPVPIEYSLRALEKIPLPRRRVETGGLLFGSVEGNAVRVIGSCPIACEHRHGPQFVLTQREREELAGMLRARINSPQLTAVGLYFCRSSDEVNLSETDVTLWAEHFRGPADVALVLVPRKDGGARAGFFVHESDGSIQTIQSHLEFDVQRPAGEILRPSASRAWARMLSWLTTILIGALLGQAAYMAVTGLR